MNTTYSDAYQSFSPGDRHISPKRIMETYIGAFEAKDANTILNLIGDRALVELPLLKPNRLFGSLEVHRGHQAVFLSADSIHFSIDDSIVQNETAAIALGHLGITRHDGSSENHEIGVVVEKKEQLLHRISIYLNSRDIRRWADETIV